MPLPLVFAWALTAFWGLTVAAYLTTNGGWAAIRSLNANEFGDFFAGVSAPLAFLWLVAATLLQRKELEQNREALMLQADQLKNSVEQQKHIAEATKEQLKQLQLAHQEQHFEDLLLDWSMQFYYLIARGPDSTARLEVNSTTANDARMFNISPQHFLETNELHERFQRIETLVGNLVKLSENPSLKFRGFPDDCTEFLQHLQGIAEGGEAIVEMAALFSTAKGKFLVKQLKMQEVVLQLKWAVAIWRGQGDFDSRWHKVPSQYAAEFKD